MTHEQRKLVRRGIRTERNRIFRLLIDEIKFQIRSKELWANHPTCSKEVIEKQVYGFDCQISALCCFGTGVFGYKKEDLLKEAQM